MWWGIEMRFEAGGMGKCSRVRAVWWLRCGGWGVVAEVWWLRCGG